MPARVVVVKRSRRRAFAAIRWLPASLRALRVTLAALVQRFFSRAPAPADRARVALHALRFAPGASLAWRASAGARFPVLREGADPARDCADCGVCIEACPSHCLFLARSGFEPTAEDDGIGLSLDLDPGRCIGCGICEDVCPSGAIVMQAATNAVSGAGGRPHCRRLEVGQLREVSATWP